MFDKFSCPNPACSDFKKKGAGNIDLYIHYGRKDVRLMICKTCNKTFSELKGTPFWDSRLDWETIERIYSNLLDGQGIRATARKVTKQSGRKPVSSNGKKPEGGISKNTVKRYLRMLERAENLDSVCTFLVQRGVLSDDTTGRTSLEKMVARFA